jgi:hypothetical protein
LKVSLESEAPIGMHVLLRVHGVAEGRRRRGCPGEDVRKHHAAMQANACRTCFGAIFVRNIAFLQTCIH